MGAKQRRQENKNIASINTDYVRSVERKESRQKAHKVRLFRRLLVLGIVVLGICGALIASIFTHSKVLAAKELEKTEVLESLKEVQEEQEMLKLQISKLNDDEYIAKLARKELFLSDDGEIIFSLPESEDKE